MVTPEAPENFEASTPATPVSGAYLTAYRDSPLAAEANKATVKVYVVINDETTGLPLPREIPITSAVARFDDKTSVTGIPPTDASATYHLVFEVPKEQLATQSVGKSSILGAITVSSTAVKQPELTTQIVIWLANIALQMEHRDYGTLIVPPASDPELQLLLNVYVSAGDLPAQNVVLTGLADDLVVTSTSCGKLGTDIPVELLLDCAIVVKPKGAVVLDRILTVSYDNGIRRAFASTVLRGESVVVLGKDSDMVPNSIAPCGAGILVGSWGFARLWRSWPETSYASADLEFPLSAYSWTTNYVSYGVPQVSCDGDRMSISDSYGVRLWNAIPLAASTLPDVTFETPAVSPSHAFGNPSSVLMNGGLIVSDPPLHGVLSWNTPPLDKATPPDTQLQHALENNVVSGVASFAGSHYLESFSDKIRVWRARPVSGGVAPDYELSGSAATGVWDSYWLWGTNNIIAVGDAQSLYAGERGSGRVMAWYGFPESPRDPDAVLGQPDLKSRAGNAFGPSIDSIGDLGGLALTPKYVLVADANNHRVVIHRRRTGAVLASVDDEATAAAGESTGTILRFEDAYFELGTHRANTDFVQELTVVHSGTTPANVLSASFDGNGFRFVGDAYPGFPEGTPGACGMSISANCKIAISPNGLEPGGRFSRLHIEYDNGASYRSAVILVNATLRTMYDRKIYSSADSFYALDGDESHLAISYYYGVKIFDGAPEAIAENATPSVEIFREDNFNVRLAAGRMYTYDQGNHGINVWRHVPTTNVAPDFSIAVPGAHGRAIVEGGRLYFGSCDAWLVWDQVPDSDVPADRTSTLAVPNPAPVSYGCGEPAVIDGKLLLVTLEAHPRLLVWDDAAHATGTPDHVTTGLFPGSYTNCTDDGYVYWCQGNFAMQWDGTHLYVGEGSPPRVQVFQGIPVQDATPIRVYGQLSASAIPDPRVAPGPHELSRVNSIYLRGGNLYILAPGGLTRWPIF